jgi:hypothetical protein
MSANATAESIAVIATVFSIFSFLVGSYIQLTGPHGDSRKNPEKRINPESKKSRMLAQAPLNKIKYNPVNPKTMNPPPST